MVLILMLYTHESGAAWIESQVVNSCSYTIACIIDVQVLLEVNVVSDGS
jgi:hypothetical protein